MRRLVLIPLLAFLTPAALAQGFSQSEVEPLSKITTITVGDYDNDGVLEFAALEGGAHSGGTEIFKWCDAAGAECYDVNAGWYSATFGSSSGQVDFAGSARSGDVDGDGDIDIVFSGDQHTGGGFGYVWWAENPLVAGLTDSNGQAPDPEDESLSEDWAIHEIWSFDEDTDHINDMVLADFDQNGTLDVAIRHLDRDGGGSLNDQRQVRVLYQEDPDSWTLRTLFVEPNEGMSGGDIDGDGYPDLWLNGFWLENPDGSQSADWTRHDVAPWAFGQSQSNEWNNASKGQVVDIDGDGDNDLLISRAEGDAGGPDGKLAIYRNERTSWTEIVLEEPWTDGHQAEVGDVDGDGNLDVVTGDGFGGTPRGIWVWFLNGDGTLRERSQIEGQDGAYTGRLGDFTGDGAPDFVAPTAYTEQVYLYVNEGFTPPLAGEGPGGRDAGQGSMSVALYPNPFSTLATLTVSTDAAQPLTVEVFDALGRRVHRGTHTASGSTSIALDGSRWTPGLYVVRVMMADGTRVTTQLVRR